jgi:YopX protein.
MDIIKFRAWDGFKYWYNVAVMDSEPYVMNYEETGLVPLFSEDQIALYGKPIVEQYIGLGDKYYKDIYVGDRLAHDDDFKHPGVVQFCKGIFGINWNYDENQDPEWEDGQMYGVWGVEHNLRRLDDGFNRELIIIGNIHEAAK